jgi:hypothetical protein
MQDPAFPPSAGMDPHGRTGDDSDARRNPLRIYPDGDGIPAPTWLLLPQAVGIGLRVTIWLAVFAVLLFGLFTYPAILVGGFLFVVLVAHYLRTAHS